MNEVDAVDLLRSAIWTVIIASTPAVLSAIIVGILIALFQALTQVQEVTLTFVPKIMAIFFAILASAYFMGGTIGGFASIVFARIETGF